MKNIYNTYVRFNDKGNNKVISVSISDLITVGCPIDDDGEDMELFEENLSGEPDPMELPEETFFNKGDVVNVRESDNHYAFTGTVVKVNHTSSDGIFYTVKDQDDDYWDVDQEDLSFNTDEYMH